MLALVSGFVHGTGLSSSSSSISTLESAVGEGEVGVSCVVAGDAREEAFGPGESAVILRAPDLGNGACGKTGISSGCC